MYRREKKITELPSRALQSIDSTKPSDDSFFSIYRARGARLCANGICSSSTTFQFCRLYRGSYKCISIIIYTRRKKKEIHASQKKLSFSLSREREYSAFRHTKDPTAIYIIRCCARARAANNTSASKSLHSLAHRVIGLLSLRAARTIYRVRSRATSCCVFPASSPARTLLLQPQKDLFPVREPS